MAAKKSNSIIVLLLSISFALGDPQYHSAFTKEYRLPKDTEPLKANNKLIFNDGYTLTSDVAEELYTLSAVDIAIYPKSILNFAKGKLLFTSRYPGGFFILNEDFTNYTSNVIPYDKEVNANTDITTVVAYNDTFDVFDRLQEICMPCRYNDKGERLPVEHTLKKKPHDTYEGYDRDPLMYDRYSLELVKDGFGVQNGYFYVYRYVNFTTALRILDSEYKVVKQRLFPALVEAHSLTGENLTICYRRNIYEGNIRRHFVECHLLNADLKTVADVNLHEIKGEGITEVTVQNLAGGGAMVGMLFRDGMLRTSVYVQRIHPDGHVDPPIQYNSKEEHLVRMNDFTFDSGEYCLVTINRQAKDRYTFVKCLKP